jgi:cyclase
MEISEISPSIIAFLRPDEGVNAGLIRTTEGVVVVDTTSYPSDMQALLDTAGASASQACLVINTHFHSDHTWGNQLFECPILAHRLCRERMATNLEKDWSVEGIAAYLAEREKTDPEGVRQARQKLAGLRITLPTETFEDRRALEIGGTRIEVIHLDAHTPDTSVVWLPEAKALFASDLIFEGRYPFLFDADVAAWITVLKKLPEFGARAIVPGHGQLCGEKEIANLRDYLEATWSLTADHIALGHSEEETVADPNFPRYTEKLAGRLHQANIKLIYNQIKGEA